MSKFDYAKFDSVSVERLAGAKALFEQAEGYLGVHLESSREKSLALTALEEAFMWVGKALNSDQERRDVIAYGEDR